MKKLTALLIIFAMNASVFAQFTPGNVLDISKGCWNPDYDAISIGEKEVLIQYFVSPDAIRVLK